MDVITPNQPVPVDRLVGLLVGREGVGKTSTGTTLNTILLDFQNHGSARATRHSDVALIRTWADLDLRPATYAKYDAVTIDTGDDCLAQLAADIIRRNPKHGRGGDLTPPGFAVLKRRFTELLATFQAMRKDVLILAHAKVVRDGDSYRLEPRMKGSSRDLVLGAAHLVGLFELRQGQRVIDFSPSDRFTGKGPGLGVVTVPPIAQAGTFMRGLFELTRARLGVASDANAETAAAVDRWRRVIASYREASEFTAGLREIHAIRDRQQDAALYAQVFHVFREAARAAGMKYEPGDRAFRFVGRPAPAPMPSSAPKTATVQGTLRDVVGF